MSKSVWKNTIYKIVISAYKGTFLLISKFIIDNIKIATEIRRKNTLSKPDKSKFENSGIMYNISWSSAILFKNKDNKILAPTTKFNNLLSVELYPITWVSPKW